jgi:exonuclease SbcD
MVEHLRLIHFADLHLGVEAGGRAHPETGLNQRIHDVCDRLDELCEVAEADQVHAVLFAGDAFKNQRPAPTLQALFARRVRRLARSGSAVFLLIGNHDLPKMAAQAHPFTIYDELEIEGVVVGDRAQIYELPLKDAPVGSIQVAALPHFSRHQVLARLGEEDVDDPDTWIAETVADTVRSLGRDVDPSFPAVFVGHCHVQQADAGTTRDLFGVSDVEVSLSTLLSGATFPYYALGHLHKRQVLSTDPFAAYSGSIERVDFGEGERVDVAPDGTVTRREAEDKGFYRFDLTNGSGAWRLAGQPEFRTTKARTFATLRVGELGRSDPLGRLSAQVAAVRAAGIDLSGAFVKVTGRIDATERQRVTRSAVRALFEDVYDVRLALEADEDERAVRDPRFAEPMPEREALAKYLETRDDWADERDEVLRLGRELIDEVLG